MLTSKLKIKSVSDIDALDKCIYQSTGLFYKLYNNAEMLADKSFKKELLFNLDMIDVSMCDFIIDDVKTKLAQRETNITGKLTQLSDIEKILTNPDKKIISKKKRYRLINKKQFLKKTIYKDSCFGGKALLRNITKHAQLAKDKKLSDDEILKNKQLYESELSGFREKRKLGIYLVGRSHEGGNRKVEFDLNNNRIIFKPNKDNHITIEFTDNRKDLLDKLQKLINSKSIPITVRITKTHVCLSYDESIVSGFYFDEVGYKRTIHENNIKTKEGKTEIAKQFHKAKEYKMLVNKIANRYASIDINPKEISLVIGDKLCENKDGNYKIIFKSVFNLEKLCDKTGLSSDDKNQKSYNNKRKHELKEIWKRIFMICMHYKVYNFVSEELNIRSNLKKDNTVEFNRQVNNIWHRELSKKLISKYIRIFGLKHIEVNPCYSSLIGNFIHYEYDPISAAIEILRRGIVKYIKGNSLYPDIRLINQEKLTYLLGENIVCQNWKSLYKQITCAGLRYRNRDKEIYTREDNYLNSHKSRVNVLCS